MQLTKSLSREIQVQRLVILTSLGTLIHWYDFFILSATLPHIFTNILGMNEIFGINLSILATVIGFFVRPLGAVIFGSQMDAHGRKVFFTRSLNLMATGTVMMTLFPFELAPPTLGAIVIIICRVMQGFALSMEYGSAICYVYESVPPQKAGYFTSLLQVTAPLGFLASLLVTLVMTLSLGVEVYQRWGWRLALALGLPLFLFSNFLRKGFAETPVFELLRKRKELSDYSLRELFSKAHRWRVFKVLLLFSAPQGVIYYLAQVYMIQVMGKSFSISKEALAFLMITIVTLVWPLVLGVGKAVDRWGGQKIFFLLTLLSLVVVPFSFNSILQMANENQFYWWTAFPLVLIYGLSVSIYAATGRLLPDFFPPQIRGVGISIPYHLGNGVFGGMVSLIAGLQTGAWGQWSAIIYFGTIFTLSLFAQLWFWRNSRTANELSVNRQVVADAS